MGIIETIVLIIMCILRMIIINLPTLLIMIGIQAIIYWLSGISIYNKIKDLMLRGI